MELRTKLERTVDGFLSLLVDEKYHELALLTKNCRLTEEQIRNAVMEYGRKLVRPPNSFYRLIDVVPVTSSKPQRWSVDFPLWTLEEGESDLSVEMTCIDNDKDVFDVELDGIHVL